MLGELYIYPLLLLSVVDVGTEKSVVEAIQEFLDFFFLLFFITLLE